VLHTEGILVSCMGYTFVYDYVSNNSFLWVLQFYNHPSFRRQDMTSISLQNTIPEMMSRGLVSVKCYRDKSNFKIAGALNKIKLSASEEEMFEMDYVLSNKGINTSNYSVSVYHDLNVRHLNFKSLLEIKKTEFVLINGVKGSSLSFANLEKVLLLNGSTEIITVDVNGEIACLFGMFVEFSEWRNAISYNIFDIRINSKVREEKYEEIVAVAIEKVSDYLRNFCGAGSVRVFARSEFEWMRGMLKNIGFPEPHYVLIERKIARELPRHAKF